MISLIRSTNLGFSNFNKSVWLSRLQLISAVVAYTTRVFYLSKIFAITETGLMKRKRIIEEFLFTIKDIV